MTAGRNGNNSRKFQETTAGDMTQEIHYDFDNLTTRSGWMGYV
jgi:hypothetical protein